VHGTDRLDAKIRTMPVRLTVWSDYLCPWCYVGAARLDQVANEFPGLVDITWKSYLLRPEPRPRTLEQFVRYTQSWQRPATEERLARFQLWSSSGDEPPSHSIPPAVAAKVAATFGAESFDAYRRALMAAYFFHNRTVSDRTVLLDIAHGAGIARDAFAARLDERGDAFQELVEAEHREALEEGVSAVPALQVDDEFVLTGALPLDAYRRIVARRSGAPTS
jgi:predicted DsbA family dithiol-disulfide isomerase